MCVRMHNILKVQANLNPIYFCLWRRIVYRPVFKLKMKRHFSNTSVFVPVKPFATAAVFLKEWESQCSDWYILAVTPWVKNILSTFSELFPDKSYRLLSH